MRKTLLFVVPLALMAMFALGAVPAGAAPGLGAGVTVVSPNLDNGFPCQGQGEGGLYSFQKYLAGQPGLPASICTGTLYSGSVSNFSASGTASNGTPYSVAGSGNITGSYYYSEPCQVTQVGNDPLTGEAWGAPGFPTLDGGLNTTLPSAVGVVGSNPVTSAKVNVAFWWSRVGVTAIVGIKNVRITVQPGNITVNDTNASGLAAAIFVPVNQPSCTGGVHPTHPGDIEIVSPVLTAGSPA